MTTLNFVKNTITEICNKQAEIYDIKISVLHFGNITEILWNEKANCLEFAFDGYVSYSDNENEKEPIGASFTCAFKTPKGYISSKKIPVTIIDSNEVTLEEATELLKFNTDAVKNTFDPFWHEHQAERRNNAAWNFIAMNHLSETDKF